MGEASERDCPAAGRLLCAAPPGGDLDKQSWASSLVGKAKRGGNCCLQCVAAAVLAGRKQHRACASRSDPGAGPRTLSRAARLQVLPIFLPGALTSPKSHQCSWLLYWERERGGLGLRALDRWTGHGVWKGRREASSRSREGGKGKQVTGAAHGEGADPTHTLAAERRGVSHSPPLHTPPPTCPRPPLSFKGNLVILPEMKVCARGAIQTPRLCDPAQRTTLSESQFPEMEMGT